MQRGAAHDARPLASPTTGVVAPPATTPNLTAY
jgi:hypothetical protein